MASRRGGKDSDREHESLEEQTKCSTYVTLRDSDTSDSDGRTSPTESTEGATASDILEVDRSKGAVPKSRSWAHASTSQTEQLRAPGTVHRQFERTTPPKTRSQTNRSLSKSPFKLGGKTFSSRSKSKSPQGAGRFLSRDRTPTEEDALVDFEDGVKKEKPARRKKPSKEPKKKVDRKQADKNVVYYVQEKAPDEEVTSQSSVSETSSVERATGSLNINEAPDAEEEDESSEDEDKRGAMKSSVSAHAVLQRSPRKKNPGPSPRKKNPGPSPRRKNPGPSPRKKNPGPSSRKDPGPSPRKKNKNKK